MRNFIIGTAGHIDHGKTALIKALTGVDTDRLKEEKERGITIDLGFSEITLPSGIRASIVDVPGHEKFIKNMLAGATAMDIILFVVAADEGVMPQSVEHLEILEGLRVKNGVIVLTKADKVDLEFLELVEENIREDFKGSFLENAKIIKTSTKSGEGLDELKSYLDKSFKELSGEDREEAFRLHVDRVFSVKGVGTVVTGTSINGSIAIDEEAMLYPSKKVVRIRGIQSHGENIEKAYRGNRLALNLAGISKEEINRGDTIYGKDTLEESNTIECRFKGIGSKAIKNKSRIRFYHGTREYIGRITFIDENGDYVKITLENCGYFLKGDHYFVRNYSPMYNLGGGIILNTKGKRKNKYTEEEIESLKLMEGGELKEIIEEIISKNKWISQNELSKVIGQSCEGGLRELALEGRVVGFYKNECLFTKKGYEEFKLGLIMILEDYHKKNNLSGGMLSEELRKKAFEAQVSQLVFREILEGLEDRISVLNGRVKLKEYKPTLKRYQENFKNEFLSGLLKGEGTEDGFRELGKKYNLKGEEFGLLLDYLKEEGEIVLLNEGIIMLDRDFSLYVDKIMGILKAKGEITLGEARDSISKNRKVTLAILEELDRNGITRRLEDKRVLI